VIQKSKLSQLQQEQVRVIESALRWLATRKHATPLGLLMHAIEDPEGDSAEHLASLVAPTASLSDATAETRALAIWGLIIDLIRKVGSADDSRRRNTLIAAFRLPRRVEILEPWKSSLGDRFKQLMDLPGVFGNPKPTTTTPMHKAWGRAVGEKLAPMLRERLDELEAQGDAWRLYLEIATGGGRVRHGE